MRRSLGKEIDSIMSRRNFVRRVETHPRAMYNTAYNYAAGIRIKAPRPLVATITLFVMAGSIIAGFGSFPQKSLAAQAVPTTPTISVCGVRRNSDIDRYTGPAIAASPISVSAIPAGFNAYHFVPAVGANPDSWYMRAGDNFSIYNATNNALISSFSIPAGSTVSYGNSSQSFGVDDAGNVYVSGVTSGAYKFNQTGTQIWHVNAAQPLDRGTYSYGTGANFRVAAVYRKSDTGPNYSHVWDAAGTPQADSLVRGSLTHQSLATGDLVSSDGSSMYIYNATGMTLKFTFGTDIPSNSSGPFHFYAASGMDELADGTIVVSDGALGLMFFSPEGQYQGHVNRDTYAHGSGAIQYSLGNEIYAYNGKIYYQNSSGSSYAAGLSSVLITQAQLDLNFYDGVPANLGIGAGPYTDLPGNYFPSGTTPAVKLKFYPWWAATASSLTGEYTIRSIQQVQDNVTGTPQTFALPTDAVNASFVPVTLSTQRPGLYEMDVRIKKNGVTTGADCLRYSIGAPGQTLDLTKTDDVNLTHQFGQKLLRLGLSIDQFYPGGASGDPNSVAPMVFPASSDTAVAAQAALAASTGVLLEDQVATGSSLQKALVANGTYGTRVQEMVSHFKPWIHAWEAWNEPNNTYSGDPAAFTNNIIKPFYAGVKAADPTSTAIGGGVLGTSTSYWNGIGLAGGFAYMDVAGVHPYTGHNRSFEEQDSIKALQKLQVIFATYGKPNLEMYDTESGFWNSGPNSYYEQGDKLIRKQILERSIGITHYANFFNSGGYKVDNLSWSLYGGGTLTPGGLASAVYQQQIGDRLLLRSVPIGSPHAYAYEFGAQGVDASHIYAIWTEDYDSSVALELSSGSTISVTDEYGGVDAIPNHSALGISGSVKYATVPAGQSLTIIPNETYPTADQALAAGGASATASTSASGTPVTNIIDGETSMTDHGNNFDGGVSVWTQNYTDTNPQVTVTLSAPKTLNRVYIASQGLGSVQTGLRSYDVQVDDGSGTFKTVAQVRNLFFRRNNTASFSAQTVKQIRITNMSANYSGYGDGLPPSFWPDPVTYASNDVWIGQTTIYELEAYAPGQTYVAPVTQTDPTLAPQVAPITTPLITTTRQSSNKVAQASGNTSNTSNTTVTPAPDATPSPSPTNTPSATADTGSSSSGTDPSTKHSESDSQTSSGSKTGYIIGGSVLGVLLLIGGGLFYFLRRQASAVGLVSSYSSSTPQPNIVKPGQVSQHIASSPGGALQPSTTHPSPQYRDSVDTISRNVT